MRTQTREDIDKLAMTDPAIRSAMMYYKEGLLTYEEAILTALAMQTETKQLVIRDFTDHLMRCTMSHHHVITEASQTPEPHQ